MEKFFAIALDIGGTSIKSAMVSSKGEIIERTQQVTFVDSKGTAETILATFVQPMAALMEIARKREIKISGIGIGMPGPLDSEKGISLIKGVDKYESIYGVNLRNEFRKRLNLPVEFPILFEIDAWSFVRGEAWLGAGRGYNRIIGLTLGTGFGSGFMKNDELVDTGPGIPPLAWIGGIQYGDGILDDRVSRRGIIRRYNELHGVSAGDVDVKDIAERAKQGDSDAIKVFEETGEILGKMLKTPAEQFRAECIIVGGQIAKSYSLFVAPLKNALQLPVIVKQAKNIDLSGVFGAARLLFKNVLIRIN